MSKEKEEGEYFISLYETLYKFNINPIEAAGFKGGKYGQAIIDAVGSGQTLAGLTKDQQIYMIEVMKNIFYPKSREQEEEGGSIPNLKFLKNLPKSFTDSLNESAHSVLEYYIQGQDSSSNSSTTSTTTTSVSTTSSLEKPSSSSGSSSTSESYTTTAYDSTHDKARITIDEISYNTKITENKVELRDATSDELVCTVQIENGRVKLIYSSHEIYTIEEDGWLFHNICGRFSGFFDKGSLHKREIHVCENLLKQQAGGATGNSDSTTLSSSSSSTSEPQTAITSVSATTLPLGGDYIDGENMSTTVTTSSLITLSSSTTIESISDVSLAGGDSSSTDAA